MIKTKVYVLEWDAWSFMGCFLNKCDAEYTQRTYMETIKEVIIEWDIKSNNLFILIDGKGEWRNLCATRQEAEKYLASIRTENEYKIEEINIIENVK